MRKPVNDSVTVDSTNETCFVSLPGRTELSPEQLENKRLFSLYRYLLFPFLLKTTNRQAILNVLNKLEQYFCGHQPTPKLASKFLVQYANKKPSTRRLYERVVRGYMEWQRELSDTGNLSPFNTSEIRITEESLEHLLSTLKNKKSHKSLIERDSLLIELAWKTGITRRELANLRVSDIKGNSLVIESAKPYMCRTLPLSASLARRLQTYSEHRLPDSKLFNLKAPCVSGKINRIAKKAEVKFFNTGTLRHEFAVRLLEQGMPARTARRLLGHKQTSSTKAHYVTSHWPYTHFSAISRFEGATSVHKVG